MNFIPYHCLVTIIIVPHPYSPADSAGAVLAVSIHSSLFVLVGIRFCSVSLSNFYVFVACLGLTVKFALKRVRSSRRVSWTLGTMYCVQTIRPINQVVWQLSNSCSPVGRMWGGSREEERVCGGGGSVLSMGGHLHAN
jgi:hypothetical protein